MGYLNIIKPCEFNALSCECKFHKWFITRSTTPTTYTFPKKAPIVQTFAEKDFEKQLQFYHAAKSKKSKAISIGIDDDTSISIRNVFGMRKRMRMEKHRVKQHHINPGTLALYDKLGMCRLIRVLCLLKHLKTMPTKDIPFPPNDRMELAMISACLPILIGEKEFLEEKNSIYYVFGRTYENIHNIIWETTRQQGKTTAMSRILAVASVLSPVGGKLACIYSTGMTRTQELAMLSKSYLYWYAKEGVIVAGIKAPVFLLDNAQEFIVEGYDGAPNSIHARPSKASTCRGDSMRVVILDEIAFVDAAFFYNFIWGLLTVRNRIIIAATTPGPFGSFFAVFLENVKANEANGNSFFTTYEHRSICSECSVNEKQCPHLRNNIPSWKSYQYMRQLYLNTPENMRDTFNAEINASQKLGSNQYFTPSIVNAWRKLEPVTDFYMQASSVIYVSVDPPSGLQSKFGIIAFAVQNRRIYIVGIGEIKVGQAQTVILHAAIYHHLMELIQKYPTTPLIPIVESNNCQILSDQIVNIFRKLGHHSMPFTRERFRTFIVPNVGVITDKKNKRAMIEAAKTHLLFGSLSVIADAVVMSENSYTPNREPRTLNFYINELCNQLLRTRDASDGSITARTPDGGTDDLMMAFCIGLYWIWSLLMIENPEYAFFDDSLYTTGE